MKFITTKIKPKRTQESISTIDSSSKTINKHRLINNSSVTISMQAQDESYNNNNYNESVNTFLQSIFDSSLLPTPTTKISTSVTHKNVKLPKIKTIDMESIFQNLQNKYNDPKQYLDRQIFNEQLTFNNLKGVQQEEQVYSTDYIKSKFQQDNDKRVGEKNRLYRISISKQCPNFLQKQLECLLNSITKKYMNFQNQSQDDEMQQELPTNLDSSIETTFTSKQQELRSQLFQHLIKQIKQQNNQDQVIFDQVIVKKRRSLTNKCHNSTYRGSQYIGVAKNGRAWQAQTTIDQEYVYLANHDDEKNAAILYDIAIIQAKGLTARTRINFEYTAFHLLAILLTESIVEVKREFDRKFTINEQITQDIFN